MIKTYPKDHEQMIFKQNGPQVKIPFVSPMLTWATSGGVPMGHFCRWYGPEHSGKSLNNWGLIYSGQNFPEIMTYQKEADIRFFEARGKKLAAVTLKKQLKNIIGRFPNGMESIIFDTEQRADLEFAASLGIDTKRVELIDNNIIEEIIRDAGKAAEAFHIIIIDSATNAQTVAEAGLDPGNYDMGGPGGAWKRLRQFRQKWDRNENVLIIVDQVRTQLGTARGEKSKVTAPNVRFLRHNSSLSIQFDAGKMLYLDKSGMLTDDWEKASNNFKSLGTNGKEPHGVDMRCKIEKNSTGKPYRNARMRFKFPVMDTRTGELIQEPGFDLDFEMLEVGLYFDIIEKSGSFYYILDEQFERVGGKKAKALHGGTKVIEKIQQDDELRQRILDRLVRAF